MILRFIIGSTFIASSLSSFASKDQFLPFFDSLEDQFLMRTDHLIDISQKIKLKKIGIFGNRNAEATYSPSSNTISLKKDYLVKTGRTYRIKNYAEFAKPSFNPFVARASTIFHELAHADFDVIIERNRSHELNNLLASELPRWFKTNFRRLNSKTATHELFGYTAGDYFIIIADQINSMLINHGLYPNKNKCLSKDALVNIAKRLNFKDKVEFKDVFNAKDYSNQIIPRVIFINGKAIKIDNLPARFKQRILNYFSNEYALASNSLLLTERLNTSKYLERLKNCYKFLKI